MKQQPKNQFESHLQKAKIAYLPKGISVLEIGCGDGSVFKDTDYKDVDGMDIDLDSLLKCRNIRNYRKLSDNIKDFDIASYDCVALLGVLEHMDWADIVDLLYKLEDAKSIYITVPNATSFHRCIGVHANIIPNYNHLSGQDIAIGHKRYFDKMSLVTSLSLFMKATGFKVTKSGTAGFKFDTSVGMIPYLDRIKAIEFAAKIQNMIGLNNYAGAELFLYLTKENV